MKLNALPPEIRAHIQINIPFSMLYDEYLDIFVNHRLNPEIGIDAAALDRFGRTDFSKIARTLHAYNPSITFHGPFIDLSPGSKDLKCRQLTRSRFEQMVELVPIFNPVTVVCHAGYDRKRYKFFKEEWLQNSVDTWSWLAKRLNEHNARLMLENVYETDPGDILMLLQNLKDLGVGFCMDTGHLTAFGRSTPGPWIDALGDYIGQFHLHDNDGSFDAHLGLGAGGIDFKPVFDFLKKRLKTPPVITLEPHNKEDLFESLDYLVKVWPYWDR